MKKFIRKTGAFLLLVTSVVVFADEPGYRIAGIIAGGAADWGAIIELPDGEQKLIHAGDFLGQVEIVRISKDGVVLQFPGGERQMQLSQGGYVPLSGGAIVRSSDVVSGSGVMAGDFSKRVDKQLTASQVASVMGLDILSRLSDSARLVSFSSLDDPEAGQTPIASVDAGVNRLQRAIMKGEALRITVEGDESFIDFYVMPNPPE